MGKKLDALLGRSFRTSKLRPIVNLALSRLAILKNQRQARCSLARSDVVHLLGLGHHERALLRVEQVVKEQNMLDALAMIESSCNVVMERVDLIREEKECPEELKEAIASLIYASSRTGEFPELQQMRAVFASRYGKEFVARCIELRNNCGVNIKMIQKLSTRQPSLETRRKVLQEIAAENGIDLNLGDAMEEKCDKLKKDQEQQISDEADERFKNSMGDVRRKYRDVADAAEEAFQSAAYAAAAAKAVVELSRFRPPDTDDHDSGDLQRREEGILCSDDESKIKESNISSLKIHELEAHDAKTDSQKNEALESDEMNSAAREECLGGKGTPHLPDGEEDAELKNPVSHSAKAARRQRADWLDDRKGPVSVRTRR